MHLKIRNGSTYTTDQLIGSCMSALPVSKLINANCCPQLAS